MSHEFPMHPQLQAYLEGPTAVVTITPPASTYRTMAPADSRRGRCAGTNGEPFSGAIGETLVKWRFFK